MPSSSLDRGVPIWPDRVCADVEYEQEKAYRLLGDALGNRGDPEATYKALTTRAARAKQTPEEVRDELRLSGKFKREEWGETKRKIDQLATADSNTPVPTRYEDPTMYKLIYEFRRILMERAAKTGQPIDFPPFLASLPSGDVNARIRDSTPPVMFFEQGLIRFLLDFSGLASWVVPVLPPEDLSDEVLNAISSRHTMPFEGPVLFASSLRSYVVDGNAAVGSTLLPARPENAFLREVLFMRMIIFVLMHEFQHLQLGHLAGSQTSKEAMWKSEYEADIAAARFVADILGGWALSFWACDLVLIAFHFLDRALGVLEFGDHKFSWTSQTHPDPISRRRALFKSVGAGVPRRARSAGGNLFAMDEALFDRVWLIILPELVSAHFDGQRPSPIWSEKIDRSMARADLRPWRP